MRDSARLRRCFVRLPWLLALLALAGAPRPAHAAAGPMAIDVQVFRPNAHTLGGFAVDAARVPGHLQWGAGLFVNYADDPLKRVRTDTGDVVHRFVTGETTLNLLLYAGFFDFLGIDLDIPFHVQMDGRGHPTEGDVTDSGIGDLRITPRAQLLDVADLFYLGLAVDLVLPTGNEQSFMGWGSVAVIPRVNFGFDFEVVELLLNLGMRFQSERELYNLDPQHQLQIGLGLLVPFRFDEDRHKLVIVAETLLFAELGDPFDEGNETGWELRAGLRYHTPIGLTVSAGAGVGVLPGYGIPDWRVLAGLHYAPGEAPNPCEDPDLDCDRICNCFPEEGATEAQTPACAGRGTCKESPDDATNCPLVCTSQDQCPLIPEDYDGWQDEDGCPDPDNDGDRILDPVDRCPNEPEVYNGLEDEDGCPDETRVRVEKGKITILEMIFFEFNKDVIKPVSFGILDEVAGTLRANPQIKLVRVEGHTDSVGNDKYNRDLSQRRAMAVMRHLVNAGIEPARLIAQGFGEDRPIDSNETAEGRGRNRRVDFIILEEQ